MESDVKGECVKKEEKLDAKFNSFLIIVTGDDGAFGRTGECRQCWNIFLSSKHHYQK